MFYKIHAPFDVMCREAQEYSEKKVLKPEASKHLEAVVDKDFMKRMLGNLKLPKFMTSWMETPIKADPPAFSATFHIDLLNDFAGSDDPANFFSRSERSMLIDYILTRTSYGRKDTQVGYKKLIGNGALTAAFPLHDGPYDVG